MSLELDSRNTRLGKLRSAWGVLATSGPAADVEEIAASGRALTEHLAAITSSHSDVSDGALAGIDNLLAEFETSIRHVATSVPVSELRASLPAHREQDRQGLLDLLDVLVGHGHGDPNDVADRIAAIDYLVTLLCSDLDPQGAPTGRGVVFDPVTLTEDLHALCESVEDEADPRLADAEAEFFAAANLDADDLREELQQRTLRKRKAELGRAYFAPRVLRSIVTYNAALIAQVADQIIDAGDWGTIAKAAAAKGQESSGRGASVFASPPLRMIAEAVRKRAKGGEPMPTPIDRIAWALDFDYLDEHEAKALRGPALGTDDDPLGTAVLVGLLSRSLAVLSIDLQDADIPPDTIADVWVEELSELFQNQINENLADDAYKVACALSELKNKFLLAPLADHLRDERAAQRAAQSAAKPAPRASTAPAEEEDEPRENAREIVREALDQDRDERTRRSGGWDFDQIPWARVAQAALVTLVVLGALGVFVNRGNPDLDRMSRDELAALSPLLERGERNGAGTGNAFVGRLSEDWVTLSREKRDHAASQIVERLRAQGIEQVMIYDGKKQVRIQALGSQPLRVL